MIFEEVKMMYTRFSCCRLLTPLSQLNSHLFPSTNYGKLTLLPEDRLCLIKAEMLEVEAVAMTGDTEATAAVWELFTALLEGEAAETGSGVKFVVLLLLKKESEI
jgi:hypothetical protein